MSINTPEQVASTATREDLHGRSSASGRAAVMGRSADLLRGAGLSRHPLFDRDLICGTVFVVLGGATLLYAQRYPLGRLTDMGPGYFPTILGGMLVFFGAIIGLSSLLVGGRGGIGRVALRPLLALVVGPVCFAILLDRIGLPLSVFCAAMIACAARPGFLRPWAVLLSLALAVICVLVFVTALGMPVRLWPAAWQGF